MTNQIIDAEGHVLTVLRAPNPNRTRLTVTAPPPLTVRYSDLSADVLLEHGHEQVEMAPVHLALAVPNLVEVRPADPDSGDPGLTVEADEPKVRRNVALPMGESVSFTGKQAQAALFAQGGTPGGLHVAEEFNENEGGV